MQDVSALSGGWVTLAAGTLYGALNTLLERQWIKALPGADNSRRKEYEISAAGQEAVLAELAHLRELLGNGEKIAERREA